VTVVPAEPNYSEKYSIILSSGMSVESVCEGSDKTLAGPSVAQAPARTPRVILDKSYCAGENLLVVFIHF
jgi:hypothetical protein